MATTPPTEEDFDSAFNSFSSDAPPSDSIPLPVDAAPPAADPPAADPPAADPPAADPPVADPPAGDPPAATPPAATPPAADPPAPAPDGDAILEGLKKLVGTPPAAAPAAAAPETPAPEAPAFNAEEQEFLTKYEEDWSDVSKGEALKRRAEYGQLVSHVFKEVLAFIKPLQDTTELLAQRTYMGDVSTAIPDYNDQLRQDVTDWVATQPAYLRPAYENVIQQGTVDEVKDLVDRFRGATGQAAAPAAAPAPTPTPKAPELSDAAKKAAAALAPVESKRSGVQQPGDPANFDDAWGQFAAAEKV